MNQIITLFTLPVYTSLSSFSPSASSVYILFFCPSPAPLLLLLFTPSPCSSFTFNRLSHLQHLPPCPSFPPLSPSIIFTLSFYSSHLLLSLSLPSLSILFTLFFHHLHALLSSSSPPHNIYLYVPLPPFPPPVLSVHTSFFYHFPHLQHLPTRFPSHSFHPHHLLISASSHFSLQPSS